MYEHTVVEHWGWLYIKKQWAESRDLSRYVFRTTSPLISITDTSFNTCQIHLLSNLVFHKYWWFWYSTWVSNILHVHILYTGRDSIQCSEWAWSCIVWIEHHKNTKIRMIFYGSNCKLSVPKTFPNIFMHFILCFHTPRLCNF